MQSVAKNSRILIIRLSSFGDVLLTTPLLRTLKYNDPTVKIDFLVRSPFSAMLENNPHIDRLILFNKTDKSHEAALRDIRYDLVLDLQNNARSNRLKKVLQFERWSAYNKQRIARFLFIKFGKKGFNSPIRSVQQRYADSCGLVLDDPKPNFRLSEDFAVAGLTKPYICVAPGAAHATKQWPVEYYIELLKQIKKFQIVLLGGAAETETAKQIADEITCINLVGETNFAQTANLLASAKGLVCNDSSIMHLAYGLSVPTVVFFGSTSQQFGFAPQADFVKIVEIAELACRPCSHIGYQTCPKKHFQCMKNIRPAMAAEALISLVGNL